MDQEKLEQAKKIREQIDAAKIQLEHWQKSLRLQNNGILLTQDKDGTRASRDFWANVSPETFKIVKAVNVAYFQEMVEELEKQFAEL